jgi:predicted MPP superfamily phosphohydrolase
MRTSSMDSWKIADRAGNSAESVRTSLRPAVPARSIRGWMNDRIEVTSVNLPVRGLPAGCEGLVACQVSDLHVDSHEDLLRLKSAIAIVNDRRPDLVFLTGDYFTWAGSMMSYLGEVCRALKEIQSPLGVYAVTGNHDHATSFWAIERAFAESGVRLLENRNHPIEFHGSPIHIVGIGDLWAKRAQPWRAFRGLGPEDCTIVLVHNPDTVIYVRHLAPGVVVSGHTHGGIIRLPVYGSPIRSFLRIVRRFYS